MCNVMQCMYVEEIPLSISCPGVCCTKKLGGGSSRKGVGGWSARSARGQSGGGDGMVGSDGGGGGLTMIATARTVTQDFETNMDRRTDGWISVREKRKFTR